MNGETKTLFDVSFEEQYRVKGLTPQLQSL
jgi:hypothetical protein